MSVPLGFFFDKQKLACNFTIYPVLKWDEEISIKTLRVFQFKKRKRHTKKRAHHEFWMSHISKHGTFQEWRHIWNGPNVAYVQIGSGRTKVKRKSQLSQIVENFHMMLRIWILLMGEKDKFFISYCEKSESDIYFRERTKKLSYQQT